MYIIIIPKEYGQRRRKQAFGSAQDNSLPSPGILSYTPTYGAKKMIILFKRILILIVYHNKKHKRIRFK